MLRTDIEPVTNPETSFRPDLPGVTSLEISRRDFIKLAIGVGGAALLAACRVDKVLAPAFTDYGSTVTPEATVVNSTVFGSGEFLPGDQFLSDTLKNSLREGFNIEIPQEATVPFSLKVGQAQFDFVSLAPLENTELGISWDEKLFIKVNDTLADLDRQEVTIDGNNLVMWSYLNPNNNQMEPVLWYPALTTQQWESLTPEQKSNFYAGFAPPSPLEGQIPGYSRTLDQVFTIAFGNLPDGALKVNAALRPIESTPAPEVREYTPGGIRLEESLASLDLEISPEANQEAIYDTIVASFVRFLRKAQNTEAWQKVLEAHPEWAHLTNSDPEATRTEAMNEFLRQTGGRIYMNFMGGTGYTREGWVDLNKGIVFKAGEVASSVPDDHVRLGLLSPERTGGVMVTAAGGKIYTEREQLVYSVLFLPYYLEDQTNMYNWNDGGMQVSYVLAKFVEYQADQSVDGNLMLKEPFATNSKLFLWGNGNESFWPHTTGFTDSFVISTNK